MEFLITFFNAILYQPLLKALFFISSHLPGQDFGIAIIILTLSIKLLLSPFSLKAIRSQIAFQQLQPKIKEIQKKYKEDIAKQSRAVLELYRKEKANPFSSFSLFLFQLPILIALYLVFLKGLKDYSNLFFLGLIDLTRPNLFLSLLAGIFQFIQSKIFLSFFSVKNKNSLKEKSLKDKDFSQMVQEQMTYLLPIFTVFIVWKLGSIIGLYWITNTLFSIGEQWLVIKSMTKNKTT